VLFSLLKHIDGGYNDVVLFADEDGSWQMDVDWDKVLPVWFRCLAESELPGPFADKVVSVVSHFVRHDRSRFLRLAAETAQARRRPRL